jgi:hypothetical protein
MTPWTGAIVLLAAQLATQSPGLPSGSPSAIAPTLVAVRAAASDTVPQGQVPKRQILFDASRFDSLTATSLRALFEEAADRGLPVRLLVNRALEGAARRVGSARILRVVHEWSDALSTAKFALGEGTTEAELDAAATAIRAGIEPRTVASLRTMRAPGTTVTALVVLTDLVQRGVPAATAREAVVTMAKQPRSDDALLGLQLTVAKNAQRGPGMAVDALNRYVRTTEAGTISPSSPAAADRKPVRPPDS